MRTVEILPDKAVLRVFTEHGWIAHFFNCIDDLEKYEKRWYSNNVTSGEVSG